MTAWATRWVTTAFSELLLREARARREKRSRDEEREEKPREPGFEKPGRKPALKWVKVKDGGETE
jgi:hypothetical protein